MMTLKLELSFLNEKVLKNFPEKGYSGFLLPLLCKWLSGAKGAPEKAKKEVAKKGDSFLAQNDLIGRVR